MKKILAGVLLAACVAGTAMAAHRPLDAQAADFAAEQARVRAALADGATYVELDGAHRKEVMTLLDGMQQLLADQSFQQLDAGSRSRVLDSQSRVNAMLERGAKDSRQVCRRERSVGSNMRELHCMTVAERSRQRKGGREGFEHLTTRGAGTTQMRGN